MAQSDAERTEAMRQRRREAGIVRGEFYAHPDDHADVKALAARLTKRRAKSLQRKQSKDKV